MLNPKKLKKDFPLLGQNLTYLDNASTTQKPRQVIAALKNYYENFNANIHRGIYKISEQATAAYEQTREHTAKFIGAHHAEEIIFTRNTTESINLVARTWGEENIKAGDEIIVSAMEHHSNLVPWQELTKRKKAKLKIIPLKDNYTLDFKEFKKILTPKTKLLAISAMSNVLGTIPPVKEMIREAKKIGAVTLVDGAQSAAHGITSVQDLDCDFFAFSGHKMLGPTGVGILYARKKILEKMPPFLHGGDMVKSVSQFSAEWNDLPWKFEAGTPNIADVIAFNEALKYLENIGMEEIAKHDQKLLKFAKEKFSKHPQITLYSPKKDSGGILSFTIKDIHPHDIAQIFDSENICIRSGHHCCQPLMEKLKIPATARLSFYFYNTQEDIEKAEKALTKTIKTFR
ncbi:cysteine desulfurase [Candidatus Peregrinibacteria bacterium]|nr:cysteine desulfurase [Candidatus Peregrinibacteria bacterium]